MSAEQLVQREVIQVLVAGLVHTSVPRDDIYIYTVTFFFFNNIITVCSATSLTGLMSSIDFS